MCLVAVRFVGPRKQLRRRLRDIRFDLRPVQDFVIRCSIYAYFAESACALVSRRVVGARELLHVSKG